MRKMRVLIGMILIFAGVFTITTIIYNKIETKQKQKEMIELFETNTDSNKEENEEISSNENINTEIEVNNSNTIISPDGYEALGIIEISKINLTQIIVEGADQKALKYYIGHIKGTSKPGEVGNIAIAGHNQSSMASVFQDLNKLELGDKVVIRTNIKKYTYTVIDQFIIEPTDLTVLDSSSKNILTMITCCNNGKQRLIVKCNLENEETL